MTGVLRATLVILAALASALASAQDYPARPIRIVVPNPPGGANEAWLRSRHVRAGVDHRAEPQRADHAAGRRRDDRRRAARLRPRQSRQAQLGDTLPGFVSVFWQGMVAAPGTPAPVAARLAHVIAESLRQPDVTKRLQDMCIEPVGSTPQEFEKLIRDEMTQWAPIVASANIKP